MKVKAKAKTELKTFVNDNIRFFLHYVGNILSSNYFYTIWFKCALDSIWVLSWRQCFPNLAKKIV